MNVRELLDEAGYSGPDHDENVRGALEELLRLRLLSAPAAPVVDGTLRERLLDYATRLEQTGEIEQDGTNAEVLTVVRDLRAAAALLAAPEPREPDGYVVEEHCRDGSWCITSGVVSTATAERFRRFRAAVENPALRLRPVYIGAPQPAPQPEVAKLNDLKSCPFCGVVQLWPATDEGKADLLEVWNTRAAVPVYIGAPSEEVDRG